MGVSEQDPKRSGLTYYHGSKNTKPNRDLKVGTWNVRSLYRAGAYQEILKEASERELDLGAIQETWWQDSGILAKDNFTFIFGGVSGHSLGTGFLVSKRIIHAVKSFRFVNDRLSYIIIEGAWYNYVVINVHCPTEDKEEEVKDLYYEALEQLIDQFASYDTKIVVGDFNAKIGKEEMFRPTIGKESLHETSNDNGIRVIHFAAAKDLIVKTTCFKHKDIHKATWTSPDGATQNQIDHFLIDKRRHTNVLDTSEKLSEHAAKIIYSCDTKWMNTATKRSGRSVGK
ncbi:hypothetical protein TSAR_008085 [Trichomalopsis sarcophagae]|uniref:Endonuclease/exonuclease/phosphatase domain-containing protein n=1 Tax=Trichomalopsis sarcophagae TaxID=543379 RepID=A0A232FNH2_9HYME|nr:hypothetical protein TSAR_008085 [Trichomalopsis sarcophagae]